MSGIDWSKAPSPRHVWLEDLRPEVGGSHSDWGLEFEDRYEFEKGGYWYKKDQDTWFRVHRLPQWNGEGLPPVGTSCLVETTWNKEIAWLPGQVVAVVEPTFSIAGPNKIAVVQLTTVLPLTYVWGQAENFRPIRTAEQIAAEERKGVLGHLVSVIEGADAADMTIAEAIYAAGYRKP